MMKVSFDPSSLSVRHQKQWARWQRRANAAIAQNIATWESWKQSSKPGDPPPVFNFKQGQRIWTRLKKFLLANIFNNKCAYCETSTIRFDGDAEHFRPKGAVTDLDSNRMRTNDESNRDIEHPGYFWLAYHWKNLLPACKGCNSGVGKQNKFPIETGKRLYLTVELTQQQVLALREPPIPSVAWPGRYYLGPDDLDGLEAPQLLHPYHSENPRMHLGFRDGGLIFAKSDKGKASISAFNLKDENLRIRRQRVQERAQDEYGLAMSFYRRIRKLPESDSAEEAWNEMRHYVDGREEYSAAAIDSMSHYGVKFGAKPR